MKNKKLIFMLLLLNLLWTGLTGQGMEDFSVEVELSIVEESNISITPKFIFPDLKESQLDGLSEIYIEFHLSAEISSGTAWPFLFLSAHCVDSDDNRIGRLVTATGGNGATHFLRITNPKDYLDFDRYGNFYYFNLYSGFCKFGDFEMIGYVDIILNASNRTGTGEQTNASFCANLPLVLTKVVLQEIGAAPSIAGQLGSDQLLYGAACLGGEGGGSGFSTDKGNAFIYPNPASSHLFIDNLPSSENTTIALYTYDGRLIKKLAINASQAKLVVDDLSSGIYWLKITNDSQDYSRKVLINKLE